MRCAGACCGEVTVADRAALGARSNRDSIGPNRAGSGKYAGTCKAGADGRAGDGI